MTTPRTSVAASLESRRPGRGPRLGRAKTVMKTTWQQHGGQEEARGTPIDRSRLVLPSQTRRRVPLICAGVPRQARDGVVGTRRARVGRGVGAVEGRGAVRAGARAYLGPRPRRAAGR